MDKLRLLKSPKIWLGLILALAAFLRFYRLSDYLQFLGDEGRDVLVVMHMIVDHQWTLLGPTASVGGFYTGPIYYYFMLPFLWLFNLDPVGPAVMAALFGLGTVLLVYFFCREFFDEKAALIAALLTALSPKMVDISRFSWNPNPMPFFALGSVFSLYWAHKKNDPRFTLLAGIGVGILYQLHYIDLAFIPVMGLMLLLLFPWRQWLKQIILISMGFVLGDSLFLIFEIRHGFPNTRSVWEFINRHGATVAPRSWNIFWLENDITRILYEIVIGFRGPLLNFLFNFSVLVFLGWSLFQIRTKEGRPKVIALVVWWLLGAFGVGLYQGTLLDHYFGYLFPIPLIFLSLTGSLLTKKIWLLPVLALFLVAILYNSVPKLFLWLPPNNLLQQTQTVDNIVLNLAGNRPYNFAMISPHNSDHAYRYFLETWQRPPVTIEPPQSDPERKTVTLQLIIVCEQECAPRGNPQWEVAGFGQAEIERTISGPAGITVYRMVHYVPPSASR